MNTVWAVLVFILCGWFTFLVGRQWFRNHKFSHLFWSISLALSFLGSLSYCISFWENPHSEAWFILYYLFGAMWMPSIMGLGSLALVVKNRVLIVTSLLVGIMAVAGGILLAGARISASALALVHGGAGSNVISPGVWLVPLILLNTFGAVAVVGVGLWSAWKTYRKKTPTRFLYGNLFLALGVIVISAAGSAARFGVEQLFWIVMLIGWMITFVGYRFLTPRSYLHRSIVKDA